MLRLAVQSGCSPHQIVEEWTVDELYEWVASQRVTTPDGDASDGRITYKLQE